jgi:hypothetical protein
MMDETWLLDGRWRLLKVSIELLSDIFACGVAGGITTDAPDDLHIIGVREATTGPGGWITFIVWSATFEPLPMTDDILNDPIPFVKFRYKQQRAVEG